MKRFLSENQALLLRLFLTNPGKSFYMQEVGRILEKKPGVFQRTLNALAEEGWLKSEYRAHARFFQANTQHPLYPELKRIVAKTVGAEGALKALLEKLPEIKLALLYGSFAKGAERRDSDVDLLIVGKPAAEEKLISRLAPIEKKLQREINYKFYSEREFRRKRAKDDPFLEEILTDKKIILKGDPTRV
ncbi:MAG: nucleotidyltransferase domain-containing protein [Candidatus Omnitrophica bacterium]|nr:nucleotidyltransferase domain-containing protein [Candidatus Omnitrophota bacterium]